MLVHCALAPTAASRRADIAAEQAAEPTTRLGWWRLLALPRPEQARRRDVDEAPSPMVGPNGATLWFWRA